MRGTLLYGTGSARPVEKAPLKDMGKILRIDLCQFQDVTKCTDLQLVV